MSIQKEEFDDFLRKLKSKNKAERDSSWKILNDTLELRIKNFIISKRWRFNIEQVNELIQEVFIEFYKKIREHIFMEKFSITKNEIEEFKKTNKELTEFADKIPIGDFSDSFDFLKKYKSKTGIYPSQNEFLPFFKFMKVLHFDSYEKLASYVIRITHIKMRNAIVTEKQEDIDDYLYNLISEQDENQDENFNKLVECIKKIIEKFNDDSKKLINLRVFNGLRYKKISQILNEEKNIDTFNENNIRQKYFVIINKLKKLTKKKCKPFLA